MVAPDMLAMSADDQIRKYNTWRSLAPSFYRFPIQDTFIHWQ